MTAPHDKLHLVYASDANYVRYIAVAACSAYVKASRPDDLIVHVLDCGIPDDAWDAFVKRLESALPTPPHLVRHPIDMARFDALRGWQGTNRTVYARLVLPSLLPEEDWCVYADGDTLFVDDPLKLLECRDPDVALQGAIDRYAPLSLRPWYGAHDIPLVPEDYLCAGFLLINLAWFRQHDLETRSMTFLHEHPDLPYLDQDTLNILCAGSKRALPDGWGIFAARVFGAERPRCIHFAGIGELPWKVSFSWKQGYRESMEIWYRCAKALLGLSREEVSKVPGWRWRLGLAYTWALKCMVRTLRLIPGVRRRLGRYEGRFCSRKDRWLFSPALWRRG